LILRGPACRYRVLDMENRIFIQNPSHDQGLCASGEGREKRDIHNR
jgi:hypothetical protein